LASANVSFVLPGGARHRIAYTIALAALAAALLIRWLLDPILRDNLPLVTLFGAVAVAVWVGGWLPAALIALLGYFACDYLFMEPRRAVGPADLEALTGLFAYVFTCALIIAIGMAMRRAQSDASERRELLEITLRSIGDAVITTDVEGRVTYLNAVAESLTGWTNEDAKGRPLDSVFRIVNEESRRPVENPAIHALREGAVVGLANHSVLIARNGIERPIDDSAAPIKDERGRVSGCVLVFRDISERRNWEKTEAQRLQSARLLASIVESSQDAIISKSLQGIIQSWNSGAERLFGYSANEAVGRHISLIIPPDRAAEEDEIVARLKAGQRVEHFETERLRSDGRPVRVSLTVSPISDDAGNVVGASKIARDVTRQRDIERRERLLLERLARTDALTGLPNRRAFIDRLSDLTKEGLRGRSFVIAMLDIDHFKLLNDSFGHVFGDRVLVAVATAIGKEIREVDFAGRLGGDEFCIALVDIGVDGAGHVLNRLRERLAADGEQPCVTVSVGACAYRPEFGSAVEALLSAADETLYEAKRNGRNCVVIK
jgi:diguanylate cyclase (GGDEF)-like protein/PAS domain S-box-containing protein